MKIGYKIAGLSACVLGSLAIVGVASFISVKHMIDINNWVNHTELVLRKMEDLEELVAKSETAARGFVITDDAHYERVLRDVENELKICTNEVRHLIADNATQTKHLDAFELAMDEKISFQEKLIAAEKQHGYQEAIKLFKNQGAMEPGRQVRNTITAMQTVEDDLLQARLKRSAEVADNALRIVVLGTIFGAVMMIFVGFKIAHDLTRPIERLIRAVEKVGRGRLEPVIGIESRDEMEDLAVAFNQMGLSVRVQMEKLEERIAALSEANQTLSLLRVHLASFDAVVNDLLASTRELTASTSEDSCTVDVSTTGSSELAERLQALRQSVQTAASDLGSSDAVLGELSRACADDLDTFEQALHDLDKTSQRLDGFARVQPDFLALVAGSENFAMNLKLMSLAANMEGQRDNRQGWEALVAETRALSEHASLDASKLRQAMVLQQDAARAAVADVNELATRLSRQKKTAGKFTDKLESSASTLASVKDRLGSVATNCLELMSALDALRRGLDQLHQSLRQQGFCVITVQRTAQEIETFGSQLKKLAGPAGDDKEQPAGQASMLEKTGGV